MDDRKFNEMTRVFDQLQEEIDRLLLEHPEAEQAIAVQTVTGARYSFVNHRADWTDEDTFLAMLESKGEIRLQYIACKWNERLCIPGGLTIDLTSWHFRERLLAAHPENKDALHLVNCGSFASMRTLESLI